MTGFHLDLTLLSRNKSLLTKAAKLGHARHGEKKISLDKIDKSVQCLGISCQEGTESPVINVVNVFRVSIRSSGVQES